MKTWILLPLVVFIAVAGYQFGYYHGKLESSEADKKRMSTVVDEEALITTDPATLKKGLQAAELPEHLVSPATNQRPVVSPESPTEIRSSAQHSLSEIQSAVAASKQQADQQRRFEQEYLDSELDMQAATQITDFFELHPQGERLYLHSVQCKEGQCQLVGEFEGSHEAFSAMLKEMQAQDWWQYAGTSSNTTSEGEVTHFVLHLTGKDAHS